MRKLVTFGLLAIAVSALAGTAVSQPSSADLSVVRIDAGIVRGTTENGVIGFKGIPFAAPPIGNLRWRVPQAVEPWQGELAATKFGPACMQTDDVPRSEDCLTLNVWRPASASTALPVMVWIYGGALVHGHTSLYPADALAKQGVIVVSMNYRMGRLGFFAHPALAAEAPDEVHGNYGYMDQRAALAWVQRNISAFGGDPKAVTLFGESAGGGSVLSHMISPLSRGLFHRAILQSPGIPTARAKAIGLTGLADAERTAIDYARAVGVTSGGATALAALRALPAERLVEGSAVQEELAALSAGRLLPGLAGSILDGKFLVETPEKSLAAGNQAMVSVIVGANNWDLGLGTANSKDALFALFGTHAGEARTLYDPKGDQALDDLKQQVLADRSMVEPARHLADQVARSGEPAWLYRFSYVAESQRDKLKGTLHGFEIPFVFNIPAALAGDKVTAADKAMGDLTSAYWVAFAKTGNPNGGGRPSWPRHDPAVDRLLAFTNSGTAAGPDPLKARLDLWQKVWSQGG